MFRILLICVPNMYLHSRYIEKWYNRERCNFMFFIKFVSTDKPFLTKITIMGKFSEYNTQNNLKFYILYFIQKWLK